MVPKECASHEYHYQMPKMTHRWDLVGPIQRQRLTLQNISQHQDVQICELAAQVCEQTLKALGMEACGDLIANRGLVAALFSPIATDSFLSAGLGLGRTVHGEAAKEGEVSRKGISCERTFAAISSTADLEAKVNASICRHHETSGLEHRCP